MRRSTFYNWVIFLLVVGLVVSWAWFLFGDDVSLSGAFIGAEVDVEVDLEEGLVDGSYYLGSLDAPVVVEIFSDFECPYCKTAWSVLKKVETEYVNSGKVRFVFNHFPLDFHENAENAALASLCAGEQGSFWDFHDKLFENQGSLSDSYYSDLALDLGLDVENFEVCVNSRKYYGLVRMNIAKGEGVGVTGTPAFSINGELVSGVHEYEDFIVYIENKL